MTRHKFAVGEQVQFLQSRNDLHIPSGTYTVTRLLPAEGGDCQYRVRNAHDGHERVMRESQLAGGPSQSDRPRADKTAP